MSVTAAAVRPETLHATPHARALRRIVRLNGEVRTQMRRLMGLKDTDYTALSLLMRRPMGPTELARSLHLTTSATTAVVDRLVAAGHAVREPHPQDRRRTTVRAVDSSRERAMAEVQQMVLLIDQVVEDTSEADQAAVLRFLENTAAHMETWRDDLVRRADEQTGTTEVSP